MCPSFTKFGIEPVSESSFDVCLRDSFFIVFLMQREKIVVDLLVSFHFSRTAVLILINSI